MGTLVIVGGQYGSEGKGVIASQFSDTTYVAIRVGGSNAGHSIIHEGRVWKMRMLPVAWTNPEATLVLGPGAVVDVPVLLDEIAALEEFGYKVRDRLIIDKRAIIQNDGDSRSESEVLTGEDNLVQRIGSTGKGIGAARARRLSRDQRNWRRASDSIPGSITVGDSTRYYRALAETPIDLDAPWVMIEGTQGYGLSLTHGPWPYVTSTDLTVTQLLNDCQLSHKTPTHVLMVLRAYPIRVAGNSGPMYRELDWQHFSDKFGRNMEERTTVTNKVRRIGDWDWDLAREAVRVIRPDSIALTFADYIDPTVEGATRWDALTPAVRSHIDEMERRLDVPVRFVGTGGPEWSVIHRPTGALVFGWGPRIG